MAKRAKHQIELYGKRAGKKDLDDGQGRPPPPPPAEVDDISQLAYFFTFGASELALAQRHFMIRVAKTLCGSIEEYLICADTMQVTRVENNRVGTLIHSISFFLPSLSSSLSLSLSLSVFLLSEDDNQSVYPVCFMFPPNLAGFSSGRQRCILLPCEDEKSDSGLFGGDARTNFVQLSSV